MQDAHLYEMESARLLYRRLRANDYRYIAPILQNETVMQTRGGALSQEQTLDWLVDMLRCSQQSDSVWFVALDKPTGAPAALCGLMPVQIDDERIQTVDCIVRQELWGIGVGRECIAACMHYAFEYLRAEHVCAVLSPNNTPALHVAAACGMKPIRQIVREGAPHLLCAVQNPEK